MFSAEYYYYKWPDYKGEFDNSNTNWTLDGGYPKEEKETDWPRRANSEGLINGLIVVYNMRNANFDYYCKGPVPGLRVTLFSCSYQDYFSKLELSPRICGSY
jgi:hypothetical protein